jgi:hypothetical protein
MKRRRLRVMAALAITIGGCGPAEIVPMTPPGIPLRKMAGEGMESEGEERSRGATRPVNQTPEGSPPATKAGPAPSKP